MDCRLLLCLWLLHAVHADLRVEIYGNSVMRGIPRCNISVANGFNHVLPSLCPALLKPAPRSDSVSLRITGSLIPSSDGWKRFSVLTSPEAWLRLWVDDHRLVDEWSRSHNSSTDGVPVTPSLLPNVSLSSGTPVPIRIDIRPMSQNLFDSRAQLTLLWRDNSNQQFEPIPDAELSPTVPVVEVHRRALQERVATGWNQWARPSNLAQIVLPQQLGIDIGVRDQTSGEEFRHALLAPQFPSKRGAAVPVRMGYHAMDGSFSRLSFVPFPRGTAGSSPQSNLNLTVESASLGDDNFMMISTNTTDADVAKTARLSIVVHPQVFWEAAAELSMVRLSDNGASLLLDAGELGIVTVNFSRPPLPHNSSGPNCEDGTPHRFNCLEFEVTHEPFVIALSFAQGGRDANVSTTQGYLKHAEERVLSEMAAASKMIGKGLIEGYDAMATAIAWNVNFDPRVSVTVPVSRTFESSFDFIFFDWDMYFLSLMGATAPAAAVSTAAFEIAISNLIEVTQTRSCYGMVMNKRAAVGSASSDSNDRTEPLVGSKVVSFIYEDSKGTARESTVRWVIQKLYPTLLRWNQWAWEERRYHVGVEGGGLLVLGSDNNLPCEGSTVGLNTSQKACSAQSPHGATARLQTAVLESGMDNSPMCTHCTHCC